MPEVIDNDKLMAAIAERAAILEYDAGMSREDAERLAVDMERERAEQETA